MVYIYIYRDIHITYIYIHIYIYIYIYRYIDIKKNWHVLWICVSCQPLVLSLATQRSLAATSFCRSPALLPRPRRSAAASRLSVCAPTASKEFRVNLLGKKKTGFFEWNCEQCIGFIYIYIYICDLYGIYMGFLWFIWDVYDYMGFHQRIGIKIEFVVHFCVVSLK